MAAPSYILRPALQSDQASIRSLIFKVGINPIGLNWRRFLVAVTPERSLIACGQIKPHSDGSCELASIAVQPDWQGIGLGTAIIEALLASHHGDLYLTCRSRLGPFYEKFGFRTLSEAEMPPYFRRIARLARRLGFSGLIPLDLLVMGRTSPLSNPPGPASS